MHEEGLLHNSTGQTIQEAPRSQSFFRRAVRLARESAGPHRGRCGRPPSCPCLRRWAAQPPCRARVPSSTCRPHRPSHNPPSPTSCAISQQIKGLQQARIAGQAYENDYQGSSEHQSRIHAKPGRPWKLGLPHREPAAAPGPHRFLSSFKASVTGVSATWMAFHWSPVFSPQPSRMHTSTGAPSGRGIPGCAASAKSRPMAARSAPLRSRRARPPAVERRWWQCVKGGGGRWGGGGLPTSGPGRTPARVRLYVAPLYPCASFLVSLMLLSLSLSLLLSHQPGWLQ